MIIFGNGSMARVLYDFVQKNALISFCADDEYVKSDAFSGRPLLRYSELLAGEPCEVLMALGFHNMNQNRKARFEQLSRCGFTMWSFIDPPLVLQPSVTVGAGVVLYGGVAVHAGSSISDNAFISSNVSIGHDCKIGAHSWINSGVALGGGVELGERCVLGMNCTIAQGVKLGAATYVGANTLVTRDTKPGAVIVSEHGITMDVDSERFLKLTKQP